VFGDLATASELHKHGCAILGLNQKAPIPVADIGGINLTSLTAEGQITVSHIAPTHAAAHRSLRNCSRITPVSVGLSFSVSGVMLRPGAM
jgi:hypothetical protein